jgi:DNA-binding MarR family transcriptional regulator
MPSSIAQIVTNLGENSMARPRSNDPSLYVLESLITYRLTRIADTLVRAASQVYRAHHGVTLTELRLLATIGRHQPLAVNEVSRLTGIDKAWVSRSLATLVNRKLVVRKPHPSDSRIVLLSLSHMGKTKVHRIVPLAAARNKRLLAVLSERKRAIINDILDLLQVQAEELLAHPDTDDGPA